MQLAILGAGNVRCRPAVAAAIVALESPPLDVRLFDANEERLEVMDRLLRRAIESAKMEHWVTSSMLIDEATEGCSAAIVCLNEDGSRRMIGGPPPSQPAHEDAEPSTVLDLPRGDLNRPTPRDLLSPRTQAILAKPSLAGLDREEVIRRAAEHAMAAVPESAQVLWLSRGVPAPTRPGLTALDWPEPLSDEDLRRRPHAILRWGRGDEPLNALWAMAEGSPVLSWLAGLSAR